MLGYGSDALYTIEAKTASYRMTYLDAGKLFTNRAAAGAVTFTLPPTADIPVGWSVTVFSCVLAQDVTVASHAVDTVTTFNDLTADSVAWSTVSERAGNGARFTWDGTGWLTELFTGETSTTTVAT